MLRKVEVFILSFEVAPWRPASSAVGQRKFQESCRLEVFVFILSHFCWLTILTQEFPHAGLRTGTDPWSQRKMRSLVSPSDFYMHIADFKVA